MCFHQRIRCFCGKNEAFLFYRDNVLPEEVLVEVFCPDCRSMAEWDPESMIDDGGWILHYDMEIASFYLKQKGINVKPTPEFLFDQEYCSWYGLSPDDIDANIRLTEELAPLKDKNLALYFNTFRKKRLERVEKLKKQGFRKALNS